MHTNGEIEIGDVKMNGQWTTVVSDPSIDDQAERSSTLRSDDDSETRKSRDCPKLEALKQIYDEICAIRRSHAHIVAENAAKRAEVCTAVFLSFFKRELVLFARIFVH